MREYVSEGLHVQKLEISAISSAYPKYCHVSVYFSTSRHHTMFANLKLKTDSFQIYRGIALLFVYA